MSTEGYAAFAGGGELKFSLMILGGALIGAACSPGANVQGADQSSQVALERKIELFVRSQFSVPASCNLEIGSRTASAFPGYDSLRVRVSQGDKTTELNFLISTDGRTLARLEKFDLDHYPPSIDGPGQANPGQSVCAGHRREL